MVGSPRRHDGGRDHRHGGDGAPPRPDPLRQRPSHCGGALPELPLDDRLWPGGGGPASHIPPLLSRGHRLLGAHRFFNQLAQRSALRHEAASSPRRRTTAAIFFKLMGGTSGSAHPQEDEEEVAGSAPAPGFGEEGALHGERRAVAGRGSIRTIMTPRSEMESGSTW